MRTGVSALGCALPEKDDHNSPGARDIADRLLASLGSMLLCRYHWSTNGRRIAVETDDDSRHRRGCVGVVLYANAALQGAVMGMRKALTVLRDEKEVKESSGLVIPFAERQRLVGKPGWDALGKLYG